MPRSDASEVIDELLCADGAPVRLGIMGGTFDPIHCGHLACAEAARAACGLAKVLFVPTGNPHFKQDRRIASGDFRFELCRASLVEYEPVFEVSDIEVRREGVTYTVDTLRELRGTYPARVELCFILGADSAASLLRWREADQLAALATFIVLSRPGYALDSEMKAALREAGFRVEYVEDLAVDVSSSGVRERLARGESVEDAVPASILPLVHSYAGYVSAAALTQDVSCDPLGPAFLDAMAHMAARRVSAKRFRHIEGVADTAAALARTYGVDERKARLAGLLHDWDKGYDDAGIRRRVGELDMEEELGPWLVEHMPQVLHGPTAATALAREFPQIPQDVIQSIARHTVGSEDMTPLDMVIYIADALEPGRQFGRIDELRAVVGQADLEELFFLTYEYWTLLLFEKRRQMHPDTIRVWNTYVARRAARKGR